MNFKTLYTTMILTNFVIIDVLLRIMIDWGTIIDVLLRIMIDRGTFMDFCLIENYDWLRYIYGILSYWELWLTEAHLWILVLLRIMIDWGTFMNSCLIENYDWLRYIYGLLSFKCWLLNNCTFYNINMCLFRNNTRIMLFYGYNFLLSWTLQSTRIARQGWALHHMP